MMQLIRALSSQLVGAEKTHVSKDNRRMPLHILQNVNEDMLVMHEEIFGPILPIMTYTVILLRFQI
jgi:coniferyl-aldehyde dehydrogenase